MKLRKAQSQSKQPGLESKMDPQPDYVPPEYSKQEKLKDKVAIITGGDSGIGRAVAVAFAREGCKICVVYYNEHKDARETKRLIEKENSECLLIAGDISSEKMCKDVVVKVNKYFGRIDILVNNAAVQFPQKSITDITAKQLLRTFSTNLFSQIYLVKHSLKYLKKGSSVINTTSVTAYRGSPELLDYSASKGAIVSFTRSLSASLVSKGIRVNAVAPGPVWTPLIPATFPPKKVAEFGSDSPMGRAGEPAEITTCFLFLASEDSSYITGQVLHPNGGEIING